MKNEKFDGQAKLIFLMELYGCPPIIKKKKCIVFRLKIMKMVH